MCFNRLIAILDNLLPPHLHKFPNDDLTCTLEIVFFLAQTAQKLVNWDEYHWQVDFFRKIGFFDAAAYSF